MTWEFAAEVADGQGINLSCEGALALAGGPDLSATAQPVNYQGQAGADVELTFETDVTVAIPQWAGTIRVMRAGQVQATRLQSRLEIKESAEGIEVTAHLGDVAIDSCGDGIRLDGVTGSIVVDSSGGDLRIKGINGAVTVATAGDDVAIEGVNGPVKVESCGADLAVRACNGPVAVGSAGGDLSVEHTAGPFGVDSVGGDLRLKSGAGPVGVGQVGGDAELSGCAGPVKVEGVDGDCEVRRQAGPLTIGRVGADLSLEAGTGPATISEVGGDLSVRSLGGPLSAGHVGGDAELMEVKGGGISVTASGDIHLRGELEPQTECELTSETGDITVEIPEEPRPVLVATWAGREFVCDLPETATEGAGPRLTLHAPGDIRISSATPRRRPGRPRRGESVPIVDRLFGPGRRPEDLREERLMVLKMVESGKVTAEEGARLLEAMGGG